MSADALSSAKAALEHANKAFPSPKPEAHEYSNASYSLVGAAKKKLQEPINEYHKTVSDIQAPGIAQGVESRNKQLQESNK